MGWLFPLNRARWLGCDIQAKPGDAGKRENAGSQICQKCFWDARRSRRHSPLRPYRPDNDQFAPTSVDRQWDKHCRALPDIVVNPMQAQTFHDEMIGLAQKIEPFASDFRSEWYES